MCDLFGLLDKAKTITIADAFVIMANKLNDQKYKMLFAP